MQTPTLDSIKERLEHLSEVHYQDILTYIDFLTYQENSEFKLTSKQLEIMKESSRSPIIDCKPANQVIEEIRAKYIG
jgi:hypothetical protein